MGSEMCIRDRYGLVRLTDDPVNEDDTDPDGVTALPLNEPEPENPCVCVLPEPPRGIFACA